MSTSIDTTHAVLKYDITRFLPIRVIIRETNGVIEGLNEESFSMAWYPFTINIFWSGIAYSMLGEHKLDAISWAESNAKSMGGTVIDPLAEDSPIEIDWARWLAATTKFSKRNAPFKVKDTE